LFSSYAFGKAEGVKGNVFTTESGAPKPERPALIVSSTSWTADENFDLLLEAVKICDERARATPSLKFPQVRLLVSGKGDLRAHYEAKMSSMDLQHFKLFTEFFPHADYVRVLGAADLGICMHFSSSKLDLPMKVVDMFGASLPVAALNYAALPELVHDGENGVLFESPSELADSLFSLLGKFPVDTTQLDAMRREAKKFQRVRWAQGWESTALPVFRT
jgi:beta-1,4-mannosyltransferase